MPSLARATPRPAAGAPAARTWRVAEVNRATRALLESHFGELWVQGELSDVTRAVSGHVYFTLNDEQEAAQIRGVLFRNDARRVPFALERGVRVRLCGRLSLYSPRGSFQFVARLAEAAGAGDLAAEFARIRARLAADGLFDPSRKRPLPMLPRVVGVVTSEAGAAMHDILQVSATRAPVRLVIADCRVQGETAPGSIRAALTRVAAVADLDVVIVARGGGASEDLWAFNDEALVRQIAAFPVPVVTGIGHEVDLTLADLAADKHTATPSHAAEQTIPLRQTLEAARLDLQRRAERALDQRLSEARLHLAELRQRLNDPQKAHWQAERRLQGLTARLQHTMQQQVQAAERRLRALQAQVASREPRRQLQTERDAWQALEWRLERGAQACLQRRQQGWAQLRPRLLQAGPAKWVQYGRTVAELSARLDAMSPLKVLARGYALAQRESDGQLLRHASDAPVGSFLRLRLADGALRVQTMAEIEEP
ncbi:MAG: exodeoxyribonuclease VII large subunit [Polyangiales bacterium]